MVVLLVERLDLEPVPGKVAATDRGVRVMATSLVVVDLVVSVLVI
jgi:hypothetical protein